MICNFLGKCSVLYQKAARERAAALPFNRLPQLTLLTQISMSSRIPCGCEISPRGRARGSRASRRKRQSLPFPRLKIWTCPPLTEGLTFVCLIDSGSHWVTNPGKTGSNHLLLSHCETITLSFAKPDGMSITPAVNPGQSSWPGFFVLVHHFFE